MAAWCLGFLIGAALLGGCWGHQTQWQVTDGTKGSAGLGMGTHLAMTTLKACREPQLCAPFLRCTYCK
jgi:hypothetical protein